MRRFWDKVDKNGAIHKTLKTRCWVWTACRDPKNGYGRFGLNYRTFLPHRLSYEWSKGAIPDGFDVDHLCKNRLCVNPDHLEAKTHFDNCPRGADHYHAKRTHCKNGHEFSEANTRIRGKHWRTCKACERAKHARKRCA